MEYKVGWQELEGKSFVVAKVKPVLEDSEVVYKLESPPGDGWRRTSFETATTGIKDWIGNIREIMEHPKHGILLKVEGVYEGFMTKIGSIKWRGPGAPKTGQRVMCTEHVNISGSMEMLATVRRILNMGNPNLGFVNIGWDNDKECRYLKIDIYTGEEHKCIGESVPV